MKLVFTRLVKSRYFICLVSFFAVACSKQPFEHIAQQAHLRNITCDIVIAGGGIAGIHTAYRLGTHKKGKVCLFEKEPRLGGRILDLKASGISDGFVIGVGARRFHKGQILMQLALELGIDFVPGAQNGIDLFIARKHRAYSKDGLARLAYPSLVAFDTSDGDNDIEKYLLQQLRERRQLNLFNDFPSYVKHIVGVEGYQYLIDTAKFSGDYQYPLDPRSYLDWLDEEAKLTDGLLYPVGGMSEFIRIMTRIAEKHGVLIFKSEPVASIDKLNEGYEIITKHFRVSATQIVIAVNAAALTAIQGEIIDKIKSSKKFQDLIGVKVVTITQWWPRAWWATPGTKTQVHRAKTAEHCIGYMEIPADEYAKQQPVTRTVYNDDLACVTFWEQLAKVSKEAIDTEISRGLRHLFPQADIPHPQETHVHIWPDAWYWLKAGSPFTNNDIARWAVGPIPGEAVSLVGESYNPQRSTWSDAAIKSSIATLVSNFHFDANEISMIPSTDPAVCGNC